MGRPISTDVSLSLGFSFDRTLANNLTLIRNAVLNQDWDTTILIDGVEGAGKSVFAQQIAYFLDVDHSIDIDTQICYYPEQFKKAVMTLKKGKAIIWDEARRGLNRRRSMGETNLDTTDLMAECRQHNLFLVIVMPSFYDMDLNVSVWRSRCLIHVWYNWNVENPDKPLVRGFFRFYCEAAKKELYVNPVLRRGYRYPMIPGKCFDGRFVNHYVVDEEAYRRRKLDAEAYFRSDEAKNKKPENNPDKQLVEVKQSARLNAELLVQKGVNHGLS